MKKNFHALGKRALALLVSLTMCVSLLQITAFAAEGDTESSNTSDYNATVTTPSGDKTEVKGSVTPTDTGKTWSGTSNDGKVTVNGITESNTSSSTIPGDKQEGTASSNTVTDDNDRPVTETGSKTDTQQTTVTDTTITEEKETITEENTTQTEWKDGNVEQGKNEVIFEENVQGENDKYVPNLDKELNTSASIKWNEGNDDLYGKGEAIGDISAENQKLKPDIPEGAESGENDKGETTWTKEESANGVTQKTTITEKKDNNGNVIGYETVVEKVTTQKGDTVTNVAENKTGESFNSTGEVFTPGTPQPVDVSKNPADKIEAPIAPQAGDSYTHTNGETGTVTGVSAILDEAGKPIGYKVTTEATAVDENGVTKTTTQTEDVYINVGNPSATVKVDTTTKTDTKVENFDVTGTRQDEVTTVTTVTTTGVTADAGNESLNVTLTASAISGNQHHDVVKDLVGENGEKVDLNRISQVDQDRIAFGTVEYKCFSGATVNVTQTVTDSNNYSATMSVILDLKESQLTDGLFLTLTKNNGETKTYQLNKEELGKDGSYVVSFDGITSGTFDLKLHGKQKFEVYDGNEDQLDENNERKTLTCFANVDLTTKVVVEINEFKVTQKEETKETTTKRTDNVSVSSQKTVTTTSVETTKVTTEQTTVDSEKTWDTQWESTFTYPTPEVPDTPDNPGGNGGGTGGGGGTTPTPPVEIPDNPDVPLEPGPGDIDNPDVPENPGDVDIEEPDVPLAPGPDTPSDDVDIADNDVPMANKPSKPAGKNPVPQSSATGLTEIEEEAVPLAEVPKTGDNSAVWIAAAVLAACGLVALGQKKREEA